MMRAVEISSPGGPEVLCLTERPMPEPRHDEVVIKVAFAGVNRPDALQRAGAYAPPPDASDLPGLECSGTVIAKGCSVTQWSEGDEVCALLPGGGYAEYVRTPAAHCLPVPTGLSLHAAACIPETFFTCWSNIFMRGKLKGGETLLVHGGTSGIGTTAIQLGTLFGARIFTTSGTAQKCKVCEDLGAVRGIDYKQEDFVPILNEAGGADVILDMVGGDYIARNLRSLAMDGRLVQIAYLQGAKAMLNLGQVMQRRLTITGSTLRPQSTAAKAEIAAELYRHVWPLLTTGRIAPVLDQLFDLADARLAHERMEAGDHIGKIALKIA